MAAKVVEKKDISSKDLESDERIIEFKKLKTDIAKRNFFKKHEFFFKEYYLNYEYLTREINSEIVLFNNNMKTHRKYYDFFNKTIERELLLSSNLISGKIKYESSYFSFKNPKKNIFFEDFVVEKVDVFKGNFKDTLSSLDRNRLADKKKHDEALIKYVQLLKKSTGGVSSSILDETGEELRKIISVYKTEAVKYGKKYISQYSIFPFKESDFDLSFDLPQTLGKTTFYGINQ